MPAQRAPVDVVAPRRIKLRKPALPEDLEDAELRSAAGQTPRCEWAQRNPDLTVYHDEYWGERPAGDDEYFERMMLEIFHAGLSWTLIWNKRAGLRRAYANFEIAAVAEFGAADVERLLNDPDVVRSARKIEAAIENARRTLAIQVEAGSLETFLRAMPDGEEAKLKTLKRHFQFMGPGVARGFTEATGLVAPPHHPYCFKAGSPVWSSSR